MNKPIYRRTFLRTTGVALTLPTLESIGALSSRKETSPPKRMVFICTKLGLYAPSLFSDSPGKLDATTEYLKILKDHLRDLTLFSGLSHDKQTGRLSHSSELTWLTAAQNPGLDGFRNSISVDQYAASRLGYVTRYPSITLSSKGEASQSYTKNGVMIPAESSPSRMFSRLFLRGSRQEIVRQQQKLRSDQSILDGLIDQTKALMRDVSALDRERLEIYLESIRKTEKNLQKAGVWLTEPKPKVSKETPKDIQNKADIIGRIRLMMDLIPLILHTDSSRIINLGIQVDHGVIQMKGVDQTHHSLSHHGRDSTKISQLKKVESAIVECFSDLLTELKQVDESGAPLLGNTSVLFGSNLGNANNHDYRNLPILLAGGGFKHNRYIAYDREDNKPLSNLFLSMLNNSGLETSSFGKSTGILEWR